MRGASGKEVPSATQVSAASLSAGRGDPAGVEGANWAVGEIETAANADSGVMCGGGEAAGIGGVGEARGLGGGDSALFLATDSSVASASATRGKVVVQAIMNHMNTICLVVLLCKTIFVLSLIHTNI